MASSKSTTAPAFVLVYESKTPKTLHARTEQECWKGHMREAAPEELERLKNARCKHCVTRVERLARRSSDKAEEAA